MSGARTTYLALIGLALAIGVVGGAPARAGDVTGGGAPAGPLLGDRASVVYPAQRLPLIFSHAAHLTRDAQLTCVACHADAATSRSAVDLLVPGEAACRTCHPVDRAVPDKHVDGQPPARCDACHAGWTAGEPPARVYLPTAAIKFDHAAHLDRGATCTGCHGDLAALGVDLATTAQLPAMASCLTCHTGAAGAADDACAVCHLTEVGALQLDLPGGRLEPQSGVFGDTHDLAFSLHHAAAASRGDATCDSCHRQRFCVDCHVGTVKPLEFHAGDYVMTHAVDARRNQPDCGTCHRRQTFCVGCHERAGVGLRADRGFDDADPDHRFHPDGWASTTGGDNRHAREARADLQACASCHREDDCLACHTAEPGSPRISPHGPGWRGSARCEALARRNARVCLRCHIAEDEQGCDWTR